MEKRNIPDDLLISEILSRLPAKYIHRLGSVSKLFRSLTSLPQFLDAVRRHFSGRYVLSFKTAADKTTAFYYSDPDRQPKISDRRNDQYVYIKFINGLVCLVEAATYRNVLIRNPATGQQFRLPGLPFISAVRNIFFYFCYDPRGERYKVLMTYNVGIRNLGMRYSVFSLGKDEGWRSFIEGDLFQLGNSRSVCIDGVLFCTNFSRFVMGAEAGVIAAFEVGSERFSFVEYPEGLPSSRYESCHVIELAGMIGVVDSEDILGCGIMRLWISKGLEYSYAWVELRVEIPSALVVSFEMCPSLSFTTNVEGEIVVGMGGLSSKGIHVYRVNIHTGIWRRIEMVIEGYVQVQHIFAYFQIDEYVETPCLLPQI